MDASQRTRSCSREKVTTAVRPRGARQICLPMDRAQYDALWGDAAALRQYIQEQVRCHPELFPPGIEQGFHLTGHLPASRKLRGIRLRQLRLKSNEAFTVRPSFVLPYLTGTIEEVDKGLLLL